MKKFAFLCGLLLAATSILSAQTQQGYVRTLERPDNVSVALEGVTVQVRGGHNAVVSGQDGLFRLPMDGKRDGDSYTLQQVQKNGFELADQGTLGRRYAYSDKVPLTVVMVSTRQLQADKQRIANNAYQTAERTYKQQLDILEKQLSDRAISEETYRTKLQELQQNLEHYQSLVEDLSDHYARTDYALLDKKEREVNLCIERGELEKADSLLATMFNPLGVLDRNREALAEADRRLAEGQTLMQQAQSDLAAVLRQQEKDAEYLYRLYTIALARFNNERALQYIEIRAALDTMNAQWQVDAAGCAIHLIQHPKAQRYLARAIRRYESLVREYPDNYNVNLAICKNQMADYESSLEKNIRMREIALNICRQHEKKFPQDFENKVVKVGIMVGLISKYSQNIDDYYSKALQLGEEAIKDIDWLEKNLDGQGTIRLLINLLREMQKSFNTLAGWCVEKGDFNQAEIFYDIIMTVAQEISKVYPNRPNEALEMWVVYYGKAKLYEAKGDLAKSEEMYLMAIATIKEPAKANPDRHNFWLAKTYLELGSQYREMQHFEKSIRTLLLGLDVIRPAVKKGPENYEMLHVATLQALGLAYLDLGQTAKSEELIRESLNQCLRMTTSTPATMATIKAELQWSLGYLCFAKGGFSEASELLEESYDYYKESCQMDQSFENSYVSILDLLAMNYTSMKAYSRSYQYYGELLPIYKKLYRSDAATWREPYSNALINQSYNALFMKEFEQAEKMSKEALKVNPDNRISGTNLAAALLLQGRYAEAEKQYHNYKTEFREGLLEDLEAFEKADIVPAAVVDDVNRIKHLLR